MIGIIECVLFFFFNDTATTEIYTLSLHDALPICADRQAVGQMAAEIRAVRPPEPYKGDRKSTRLNSSHLVISYAVFCLKKKKTARYTSSFHAFYRLTLFSEILCHRIAAGGRTSDT